MPYRNRRHISQAVKEQIIAMSAHMKASQIAQVIGISGRTVRRTLDFWWKTGSVTAVKRSSNKPGRPRRLNSLDILVDGLPHFSSNANFFSVSRGLHRAYPRHYLTELQQELEEACGVRVDETTISRTLRQRGLSRKQVSKYYSSLFSVTNLLYSKRSPALHWNVTKNAEMLSKHLLARIYNWINSFLLTNQHVIEIRQREPWCGLQLAPVHADVIILFMELGT
ncbi:hypothetical protein PAXRUDRAFT_148301 [Paxillus rubicundulus Ve08.2h10]|uniref:Uncharacterized protein n=1 Tax=Paxillus rubicundulus Ve08.2h10 TaxID=930991 RepID=A0A0D0DYZ1_9AGAM|nr:hypothetical protein PAXRUDRAFT_148301 [Paxillus rubicundulus Ve08.2h10]